MAGATGPKRNDAQRDRDRARIAELYLQGNPLPHITNLINEAAEGYEITYQTVWNDLKWVRKKWQKEAKKSIDLVVAEQLQKIDLLEREYYTAWLESMKEKKSSSVRHRASNKPKRGRKKGENGQDEKGDTLVPIALEKWERREQRLGDPRYLDGFRACIKMRLEIVRPEGPDPALAAKEIADKVRGAIVDIDEVMNVTPPEETANEDEKEPVASGKGNSEK